MSNPTTPAGEPRTRILFDVTGLLHWYAFFSQPSGIQRVVEKLIDTPTLRSLDVEFVARVLGSDAFHRLDGALLADLNAPDRRRDAIARLRAIFVRAINLTGFDLLATDFRYFHTPYALLRLLRLERATEALLTRRWPRALPPLEIVPPPGPRDVLIHPGDLFWQKRCVSVLVDLKRATGVRLIQIIHDLFMFERPEWFQPSLVRQFTGEVDKLAPHVDHWLTNSRFVSGQLRGYLERRALPVARVDVLPMGWDSFHPSPGTLRGGGPASDDVVLRRMGLADRPFILFVGTVEPRKNLPTLLDALAALRSRLGAQVPDLVVVGGWGWRSAGLKARIQVDRTVHWFRSTSDAELTILYRRALFSVAPSFSEGWGLPVQESLAHGLPCIASSGGALPEAAHGLAELFDPTDVRALESLMAVWITDEEALAAARARILDALAASDLPTWDHAAALMLRRALEAEP